MAFSINDVITLAHAGFSKSDIAAFMNLGNPQTTSPAPVPVPQPPVAPTAPVAAQIPAPVPQPPVAPTAPVAAQIPAPAPQQTQAPAQPDYSQMMTALADLSSKVNALSVPSAGNVGALPTVTSVEDIIMGAIKPAAPDNGGVDFMKGVTNHG